MPPINNKPTAMPHVQLRVQPGSVTSTHIVLSAMVFANATVICSCGAGHVLILASLDVWVTCPSCGTEFAIRRLEFDATRFRHDHPDWPPEVPTPPGVQVDSRKPLIHRPAFG